MREKKKPTLMDVAELAGVSAGTVSKYLSDPKSLKVKNQIAISNAIEVLDYTPNTIAQRLATGDSDTILMYIADESNINVSTWLHQLPAIQALNDGLMETKYDLQIKIGTCFSEYQIMSYISHCLDSGKIDAVVILSAWTVSESVINILESSKTPFIILDSMNPYVGTNQIYIDNEKMVEDITDHLVKQGHREIGFVTVKSDQQHINSRFAGYKKGMLKHGLDIKDKNLFTGDFGLPSGKEVAEEFLKRKSRCTAVICGNDNMAVGLINGLKDSGVVVPEQVSVTGVDNSIIAQAVKPQLNTVKLPMKQMGELAAREILRSLEQKEYIIPKTIVPYVLVPGESVATL